MSVLQTAANKMACVVLLTLFFLSSQSQSNYAVSFDGVDDYISLPAAAAVSQLNNFTIEAWVYWNGSGNACIYSETVQGNNIPMFSISPRSADAGGIELVLRDNAATGLVLQPAAAAITANTWVHLAVVRTSATTLQTYINGVLKDNTTFTAPAPWTPDKVNIGIRWRASQDGPFGGKIEDVRIWNTARTQAQIKANMFNNNLSNNASGLVAYYKMNEGSGTNASNSSSNTPGINGTLTNGPAWSISPIQFGGNALHFDQLDDRLVAPLATTATSNVTMEMWLNHEGGTGTDHLLVSNGVMGTNGYAMYINTQRKLCVQFNAVGTWNTNYVVPSNSWTHIALVIGTTGFTLYANGVNVYSNTAAALTPTGNFILGYNTVAGGQPFDGMIDEVRIWNTARTQTEIQNNRSQEIDPSTPGLTLYYTFNQGVAAGTNTGLTTVIDLAGNNNGTLTNFSLSGTTSNFLAQNSSVVTLPLRWLAFTVQEQNKTVVLEWATASEVNLSGFVIERSVDVKQWQTIGSVPSVSAVEKNEYRFTDALPLTSISYYRIRENDRDGSYSYSNVKMIRMKSVSGMFELISNPVINKTLQVQINTTKQNLQLFTGDGKLLWIKQLTIGGHTIDVSGLTKGMYILSSGEHQKKLVIR